MYWAQALADTGSMMLSCRARFAPVARHMAENEAKIVDELNSVQGPAMDVGGYYKLDAAKASAAMRPSATLNAIVAAV